MPHMSYHDPTDTSSSRNLRRLFLLRSLMIAGLLLAIPGVHYLMETPLPLLALFTILGLMVLVNLWTWLRIRRQSYISNGEFFIQLTIDVLALTGLLYFTGGASNPFAWFFLIPLMIAATVLSARLTWIMAAMTIACYTLLMVYFQPMAGSEHMQHSEGFTRHIFGMWFGFVFSATLIAWFVAGMANTLRERDRHLAEAREQALKDEQLVALGTLATGAAHELGTPLGTMAIIANELQRTSESEPNRRKLTILRQQVDRCKQALSVISASAGEAQAESGSLCAIPAFIEQIVAEWKGQRPGTRISTDIQDTSRSVQILDEITLHQSLINLLNNAADASVDNISLSARWNTSTLTIDILDRGPGLHPKAAAHAGSIQPSEKDFGMGLGLFLTHSTIRRLGGDIELFDREGGGTCTRVRLPASQLRTTS